MDKGQLQSSPAWRYATPLQQGRLAQAISQGAQGGPVSPSPESGGQRRRSRRVVLRR
ncbi:MAG: hypothetical protein HY330_02005 [Chloroflexi bacterium]|nr:hypothetical protein [Chloroflexota bacterium]